MFIEFYSSLNAIQRNLITEYIKSQEDKIQPYHYVCFAEVIENSFHYKNLSLVAFDRHGKVIGYLPQWKKGKIIESIPWRDKGGPIYCDTKILQRFIEKTKQLVSQYNCKGFIWKDFVTTYLDNYQYFTNIELSLNNVTEKILWQRIKNRRTIRQAIKNNLHFRIEPLTDNTIKNFYKLFLLTRKRLGVPVYREAFFFFLIKSLDEQHIKIFSVYSDDEIVASMIVLQTPYKAIYAYGASNEKGFNLRANDFLMWNVILSCILNGINTFDFGADSPLQETLLRFKKKWSGQARTIATSYYGNVRELDHHNTKYKYISVIFRLMPLTIYKAASHILFR